MGNYIRTGNTVSVAAEGSMQVFKELPAAVYTINMAPMQPITLKVVDDLAIPSKIYGDINEVTERIINTFKDRASNTGVLLEGLKGSGKTLLAKNISVNLLKQHIPTIIVAYDQICSSVVDFIDTIDTECVVLFDEIDKCPDDDNHTCTNCMLSMLDGLSVKKKLFILTANEYNRINNYFKHRPGRIYYKLKFEGLPREFVKEYAEDALNNKDHLEDLLLCCDYIKELSFDVLASIIEEMNRYNSSAKQALRYLNVEVSFTRNCTYTIKDTAGRIIVGKYDGEEVLVDVLSRCTWNIWVPEDEKDVDYNEEMTVCFNSPTKITKNTFVYEVTSNRNKQYVVEFKTKEYPKALSKNVLDLLM